LEADEAGMKLSRGFSSEQRSRTSAAAWRLG
jgi:hypothetical protein